MDELLISQLMGFIFLGGFIILVFLYHINHNVKYIQTKLSQLEKLLKSAPEKAPTLKPNTIQQPAQTQSQTTPSPAQQPVQSTPQPTPPPKPIQQAPLQTTPPAQKTYTDVLDNWLEEAPIQISSSPKKSYLIKPATPTYTDIFFNWLKQDILQKIGAVFLILAFGWFTSYAFSNNWVSVEGQILLGLFAGFLFIALGYFRAKKSSSQSITLTTLGITVASGTVYAAVDVFQLITPTVGLSIIFATILLAGIISLKHKQRVLASLTLVVSTLAPLFTGSFNSNTSLTLAFLVITSLGLIWLSIRHDWDEIPLFVIFTSFIYALSFNHQKLILPTLLYTLIIFLIVFATNLISILNLKKQNDYSTQLTTLLLNTLSLVILLNLPPNLRNSFILGLISILYLFTGILVHKLSNQINKLFSLIYPILTIVLLSVIALIELEGIALFNFFLLEIFAAYLGFKIHPSSKKEAHKLLFLLIAPLFYFLPKFPTFEIGDQYFFAYLIAIAIFSLSIFTLKTAKTASEIVTRRVLLVVTSLLSFDLYWESLKQLLSNHDQLYILIALITFTILGLATYFYGHFKFNNFSRLYGTILLGFIIARLLLVDIWNMPIIIRIGLFFIIGLLLLLAAFIPKPQKPIELKQQ